MYFSISALLSAVECTVCLKRLRMNVRFSCGLRDLYLDRILGNTVPEKPYFLIDSLDSGEVLPDLPSSWAYLVSGLIQL